MTASYVGDTATRVSMALDKIIVRHPDKMVQAIEKPAMRGWFMAMVQVELFELANQSHAALPPRSEVANIVWRAFEALEESTRKTPAAQAAPGRLRGHSSEEAMRVEGVNARACGAGETKIEPFLGVIVLTDPGDSAESLARAILGKAADCFLITSAARLTRAARLS